MIGLFLFYHNFTHFLSFLRNLMFYFTYLLNYKSFRNNVDLIIIYGKMDIEIDTDMY